MQVLSVSQLVFSFIEGPVWIEEEKRLLFSDIPANRIYRLTADGRVMTFREAERQLQRFDTRQRRPADCVRAWQSSCDADRNRRLDCVLARDFHGKKLNSPNDVVVKSDGAIYFTDPAYGITPDRAGTASRGSLSLLARMVKRSRSWQMILLDLTA